jgi:regulatory protein
MARRGPPRPRPPLNEERLQELALRYVGRFATSRAKLVAYLARKVRERGWEDGSAPDFDALADRFCALGYIDDAAYALAKSQALTSRGYGKRRLEQTLRVSGIGEEEGSAARAHADSQAVDAALRFAQRRRLGPYGSGERDLKQRERALAAMIRAGHSFPLAQAIVDWPAEMPVDFDEIAERAGLTPS